MKALLLAVVVVLLASTCFASVTVQLSSPAAYSTVGSPFHLAGTASSTHPITGWQVYLDSKNVYTGPATGSISTYLNAATGAHQLVVRAWDSSGANGSKSITFTVGTVSTSTSTSTSTTSTSGVSVKVSAPLVSSVTSPFALSASASSSHSIVGWHVYLDSVSVYTGGATASISTSLKSATGTHQLVVRAWDSTGAFSSQNLQITVGTATAPPPPSGNPPPPPSGNSSLPTPPSTATVFTNIDDMTTGWGACETGACAGGSGAGTYWQAFNQTSPSQDGTSMEVYKDGAWGNALWWRHMGANNNATNLLWDFYVQLDQASLTSAQALEYDGFQFVAGYNYMIGTQCNYAAGVWDTWNEATGNWLHTTIPCQKFTAGTWHHIQWYMTTNHSNHSYTYVTLVVDGVVHNLNQTQYAKYLGWGDNIGAQWQLDVNATGGGYHEWVDKATLTVW